MFLGVRMNDIRNRINLQIGGLFYMCLFSMVAFSSNVSITMTIVNSTGYDLHISNLHIQQGKVERHWPNTIKAGENVLSIIKGKSGGGPYGFVEYRIGKTNNKVKFEWAMPSGTNFNGINGKQPTRYMIIGNPPKKIWSRITGNTYGKKQNVTFEVTIPTKVTLPNTSRSKSKYNISKSSVNTIINVSVC
jgi:hypothetical protein